MLPRDRAARAHVFGRGELEPAGEHRQPLPTAAARAGEQQLEAPVDRGAQRLLAGQRGPVAARSAAGSGRRAGRAISSSDSARSRDGGQLDGERDAVQPPADPRHRGAVRRGRRSKPGCGRRRARRTAAPPRRGSARSPCGRPAVGHGQRRHARGPSRRRCAAARGWWPGPAGRAAAAAARSTSTAHASSRCSQLSSTSSRRLSSRCSARRLRRRCAPRSRDPSAVATVAARSSSSCSDGQLHEPRPVGEGPLYVGRDLQREPCLADTAHAREHEQA